jgi:hypothetical protein
MFDWIAANWLELTVILTSVVLLAERITALTPSETDDKWVAWVKNILNVLSLKKN